LKFLGCYSAASRRGDAAIRHGGPATGGGVLQAGVATLQSGMAVLRQVGDGATIWLRRCCKEGALMLQGRVALLPTGVHTSPARSLAGLLSLFFMDHSAAWSGRNSFRLMGIRSHFFAG
jgi:hypothetical protein